MGWLIRFLLIIAGYIASFFVGRDALNFNIVQMVIGLMLFSLIVIIIAFWSSIKNCLKRKK